ncbi:MAG: NosD domain-containing protein [Thermoplasmata archaeon]
MNKGTKHVYLAAFVLLVGIIGILALVFAAGGAKAATLMVSAGGGQQYTTIQAAVDAASDGDTVYVYNGIYNEHLTIPKAIDLIGENQTTTIIDGESKETVVSIASDYVSMTNFTVENSGSYPINEDSISTKDSGVYVNASNVYIAFNIIKNNAHCIKLEYAADNIIERNIIMKCGRGISASNSPRQNIIFNTFTNCLSAIYLADSNNIVASNIFNNNNESIDIAGSDNNITLNVITNSSYGIFLFHSSYNNIISNTLTDCESAIYLFWGSSNNNITHNNIYGNKKYGLLIDMDDPGTDNTVINNWWGSASGPYNVTANPSGTGDNITDEVSANFLPCAIAPFNIEPDNVSLENTSPVQEPISVSMIDVSVNCTKDALFTTSSCPIYKTDSALPRIYSLDTGDDSAVFAGKIVLKNRGQKTTSVHLIPMGRLILNSYCLSTLRVSPLAEESVSFVLNVVPGAEYKVYIYINDVLAKTIMFTILDDVSIYSTNFDVHVDGYSFANFARTWGHDVTGFALPYCYGMSCTSVLRYEDRKTNPTMPASSFYASPEGEVYEMLVPYQYSQMFRTQHYLSYPNNYDEVKTWIKDDHPAVLALTGMGLRNDHAIVVYKAVEYGQKAYLCVYDSNFPYKIGDSPYYNLVSYRWAVYDKNNRAFSYYAFTDDNKVRYIYTAFEAQKPQHLSKVTEFASLCSAAFGEGVTNVVGGAAAGIIRTGRYLHVLCPVNVMITDQYNRRCSYTNGVLVSEIHGVEVYQLADTTDYFLPSDLALTLEITGNASGEYNMIITDMDNLTNTIKLVALFDLKTNIGVSDTVRINRSLENFEITTGNDKKLSLSICESIGDRFGFFYATNITADNGTKQIYDVLDWNNFVDSSVGGVVRLSVYKNNCGTPDSVTYLKNEWISLNNAEKPTTTIFSPDVSISSVIILLIVSSITFVYFYKTKIKQKQR